MRLGGSRRPAAASSYVSSLDDQVADLDVGTGVRRRANKPSRSVELQKGRVFGVLSRDAQIGRTGEIDDGFVVILTGGVPFVPVKTGADSHGGASALVLIDGILDGLVRHF